MRDKLDTLLSMDTETIPNLTADNLKDYENKLISKINSSKKYTDKTKKTKTDKIKTRMMEFKSGIRDTEFGRELIHTFSKDPLNNIVVAVGLTYEDNDGVEISTAKASKNEKELMEWFVDTVSDIQDKMKNDGDLIWGTHYGIFDFRSLRLALIRNNVSVDKIKLKRDTLFPIKKYSDFVIDSCDMMECKLDELSKAVLGEGKINNGSKVYEMFMNNEIDEIQKYVLDDAQKTFRNIIKIYI